MRRRGVDNAKYVTFLLQNGLGNSILQNQLQNQLIR